VLFGGLAGTIALEKLRGATPDGRSEPLVLRVAHDPLAAFPTAAPRAAQPAADALPLRRSARGAAAPWPEARRAAAGGR
jgi:hypothetical protein